MAVSAAGRICPIDYQLSQSVFASGTNPEPELDVLYLAGGLYGNTEALTEIERIMSLEPSVDCRLVLNGDFHWFDADPAWFELVHQRSAAHWQTRGNVETEMSRGGNTDAGCGCAYPESVADEDVSRSNRIMMQLGQTAHAVLNDAELAAIGNLPSAMTVRLGDSRVGITHGDDQSLAGWSFAEDQLGNTWDGGLAQRMFDCGINLFASSHTCLPVADTASHNGMPVAVINNGSAGMANFAGTRFGVVSRVAHRDAPPCPMPVLYEALVGDLHVSAIAVKFDMTPWLARFEGLWRPGSDASVSYLDRIKRGPGFEMEQAARGTFVLGNRVDVVGQSSGLDVAA